MKPRILVLGASRYYARSILAAKEVGCFVVAFDRDPAAYSAPLADVFVPIDITDIAASIVAAKRLGIDGVVPVNDFGVPTAAAVAEELGFVGISVTAARNATHKGRMRELFEREGVPSVPYRVVTSVKEAVEAAETLGTWPLIVKPADSRGGGSRGVRRIDSTTEIADAIENAQSFYDDKSVVLEEYVEGSEHSIETFTFAGSTRVLAVSDKVKTPAPYRVDKSVEYPSRASREDLLEIQRAAVQAVEALGIDVGPAHVELCLTTRGPALFEVGARCGGGGTPDPIVPFLNGIEPFKEAVRVALGGGPNNLHPRWARGCVYRFLTPKPGVVRSVSGRDEVRAMEGVLDCDVIVRAGEEVRPIRCGADRSGFIIVGGVDLTVARRLADAAELAIQFEYEYE